MTAREFFAVGLRLMGIWSSMIGVWGLVYTIANYIRARSMLNEADRLAGFLGYQGTELFFDLWSPFSVLVVGLFLLFGAEKVTRWFVPMPASDSQHGMRSAPGITAHQAFQIALVILGFYAALLAIEPLAELLWSLWPYNIWEINWDFVPIEKLIRFVFYTILTVVLIFGRKTIARVFAYKETEADQPMLEDDEQNGPTS